MIRSRADSTIQLFEIAISASKAKDSSPASLTYRDRFADTNENEAAGFTSRETSGPARGGNDEVTASVARALQRGRDEISAGVG